MWFPTGLFFTLWSLFCVFYLSIPLTKCSPQSNMNEALQWNWNWLHWRTNHSTYIAPPCTKVPGPRLLGVMPLWWEHSSFHGNHGREVRRSGGHSGICRVIFLPVQILRGYHGDSGPHWLNGNELIFPGWFIWTLSPKPCGSYASCASSCSGNTVGIQVFAGW